MADSFFLMHESSEDIVNSFMANSGELFGKLEQTNYATKESTEENCSTLSSLLLTDLEERKISLIESLESIFENVSERGAKGIANISLNTTLNASNISIMSEGFEFQSEEDASILASHCLYVLEYYNNTSPEFRDQKKSILVLRVISNFSEFTPTSQTRKETQRRKLIFVNNLLADSERVQYLLSQFISHQNSDKVQYLGAKCISNLIKHYHRHSISNVGSFLSNETLSIIGASLDHVCESISQNSESYIHIHFCQVLMSILFDHFIEYNTENQVLYSDNDVIPFLHHRIKEILFHTNQTSLFSKCLSLLNSYCDNCIDEEFFAPDDFNILIMVSSIESLLT